MTDYGLDYVDVTVESGVATVRILDPNDGKFVERSHPMHRDLRDVWPRLGADASVDAAVFAGGYKHFLPRPRLPEMAALLAAEPDATQRLQDEARAIVQNMLEFSKPLVAAARGPIVGMGGQIALLADFVVASRDVTFRDTHVPIGLASGDGATAIWPLVIGLARARRYILRGKPLDADDCYRLGIIDTLVETAEDAVPAAQALAFELAQLPHDAYRGTKQALNQWLGLGADTTLELAARLQVATFDSGPFRELLDRHAGEEK